MRSQCACKVSSRLRCESVMYDSAVMPVCWLVNSTVQRVDLPTYLTSMLHYMHIQVFGSLFDPLFSLTYIVILCYSIHFYFTSVFTAR